MQAAVSDYQETGGPFDRQRSVFNIAGEPDLPGPTAFRDRHSVLLLGNIKSHKDSPRT